MKKHYTLLMLVAGLNLFLTHATTITASSTGKTTGTEPIILIGEFNTGGLCSGSDAITVEVQ